MRTDEEWEVWGMNDLLKTIVKWLKRNQPESGKEMGERNQNVIGSAKGGHKPSEDPIAYLDMRTPTGGIAAQCMIPLRNDVSSFQKNACETPGEKLLQV